MPQQTLDHPEADEKSRIDRDWDREFNSIVDRNRNSGNNGGAQGQDNEGSNDLSNGLRDQESNTGRQRGGDQSVAEREKTPSNGWKNNTSNKKITPLNKFGKIKNLKKAGPLGIIGTLLLGGGGLLSFFSGSSLLIVHFVETLEEKFNHQLSTMEIRTNRIYRGKINNSTTGICSPVKIRCKYSTFSKREVANFKKAGIEFEESSSKFEGREKPKRMKFEGKTIEASDFLKEMSKNERFNAAVKKGFSPKFAGFSDKVFKKLSKKFGISKKKPFSSDLDSDESRMKAVEDTTKNGRKNENNEINITDENSSECTGACLDRKNNAQAVSDNLNEVSDSVESDVSRMAKSAGKKSLKTVTSSIKITGAVDNVCQVYGMYKTTMLGAKIIRSKQFIRLFMVIGTVASMIKAGDAEMTDTNFVGNLLTKVLKDSDGTLTKSATDSFGYKYAAYGEHGIDDAAGLYTNGGSFGGQFVKIVSTMMTFFGDKGGDKTCGFNNNILVQGGVLIGSIALMFVPGANVAIQGSKMVTQVATSVLVMAATTILPGIIADIISGNIIDENSSSESIGNASISGYGSMTSQLAIAGGTAPLTREQAVANQPMTAYINSQYAAIDRVNLSPFDTTSKNTFLGSIYNKFVPTFTSLRSGNVATAFGSILKISTNTLGNIRRASAATPDKYDECQDIEYNNLNLATDPFCNVVSGMPSSYASQDPSDIIDRMISRGDIDEDGNPLSDEFKKFNENCIDREYPLGNTGPESKGDDGAGCLIHDSSTALKTSMTDSYPSIVYATSNTTTWKPAAELTAEETATQKITDYYLFTVDQRISDSMDNGYAYNEVSSSASTGSSTVSGEAIGEPEYDQAQPEADRAAGKEVWPGKNNGKFSDSDLVALSFEPNTDPDLDKRMYTQAAKAMEAMNKAYNEETGGNLEIREGYRSYDRQSSYYSQGLTEAPPGTSNHGWGLAADLGVDTFDSAIYLWLKANGPKYGFINPDWAKNRANPLWYRDEPWHWEYARKVY